MSFGRRHSPRGGPRWPWLVVALCLIAATARLAIVAVSRDGGLGAHHPPVVSATTFHRFPDGPRGAFAVTATAISSKPGTSPTFRLAIRGRGQPGQRYGLLGGLCGGQFVASSDWAQATADASGKLTFTAPDLPGSLADPRLYMFVYRLADGVTLGGIKGPLLGAARPFSATPPC